MSKKLARRRERKINSMVAREKKLVNKYLQKNIINKLLVRIKKLETITRASLKIRTNELILPLLVPYPKFIHRRAMSIYNKSTKEIVRNFSILKNQEKKEGKNPLKQLRLTIRSGTCICTGFT